MPNSEPVLAYPNSSHPRPATLADLILTRAQALGEAPAFRFLAAPLDPAPVTLSYAESARRAQVAAGWMAGATAPDDLLLVLLPTGPQVVGCLFGALLAGRPAALLPAPRHRRDRRTLDRLEGVLDSLRRPCHLVIPDGRRAALMEITAGYRRITAALAQAVEVGTILEGVAPATLPVPPGPDTLAYVQFTSGSTAAPRGVMLTHRALLAGLETIAAAFHPGQPTRALSWLPLHHDMGLVGHLLQPLYRGGISLLAETSVFAADPLDWLRALGHWRATASGAPPFAFQRAARALEALSADARAAVADLSALRTFYIGAEPVPDDLPARIARLCAPMGLAPEALLPCYGLAEATLFAAGAPWTGGAVRYPLASGIAACIADPNTAAALPAGEEGEIWLAGTPLGSGYLDAPEATAETFVERDGCRWLRTGDLGRLTLDGLIIGGRHKDMIIHRGGNLHATDLETAARAADPRLATAVLAALPDPGPDGEGVALLIERRPHAGAGEEAERRALAAAVTGAVAEAGEGIRVRVLFHPPGTLPRTTSGKLARHAAAALLNPAAGQAPRVPATAATAAEPVAIIGLACRFPGADTPEAFWQALEDGRDLITEVPPDRWDAATYYDPRPAVPGKMNTRWGGFIDRPGDFDAAFFGISDPEAAEMDPQQRLALETAWRACEHAGLSREALAGSSTGVFVGLSTQDYLHLQIRQRPDLAGYTAWSGLGSAGSIAANRISYLLDLRGPSMAVDTACSSSLTATQLAMDSLRAGRCDLALAGGVSLILSPGTSIILSQFHMMAGDGRCKVFDLAADGYVRSEGCGMVVLKRLADARRDGDRVWAIIRGGAMAQDGRSPGITAPNPQAQADLLAAALADAGTAAREVDLVEAHGTGTIAGDPAEFGVIAATYGRAAGGHCAVGSVKANAGHLEAAAGVASLIKVVGVLQRGVVPPQIHYRERNPKVVLKGTRLHIPTAAAPWPALAGQRRVAALSSFGFGGALVHMIVEEGDPLPPPSPADAAGPYLVPLSARDPQALADAADGLRRALDTPPSPPLAAVAQTLGARRTHFPHRVCLIADSTADFAEALTTLPLTTLPSAPPPATTAPRVAWLFNGQGSQVAGMGLGLAARFPVARATLDACAAAFAEAAPEAPDLYTILNDRAALDSLPWLQPALCAVELAQVAVWRSAGLRPAVVLGHSLGAYAAAACAGVAEPAEIMTLVTRRAALMTALTAATPGAMLAVAAPAAAVMAMALPPVEVAVVNGPAATVLGGPAAAVAEAAARLSAQGVTVRLLNTPQAFHTALMDPVTAPFAALAAAVPWRAPEVPWISDTTGKVMTAAPDGAYWSHHLRQPVAFAAALSTLEGLGVTHVLEIGPGRGVGSLALAALGRTVTLLPGPATPDAEARALLEAARRLYCDGADLAWDGVLGLDGAPPPPLPLPGHPLRRRHHWFTPDPTPASATPPRQGSGAAPAPALPTPTAPAHFVIDWEDQGPLPSEAAATRDPGQPWIVVGDAHGLGTALLRALSARGQDAYLLLPDPAMPPGTPARQERGATGEGTRLRLAPADLTDAQALGRVLSLVMIRLARADARGWRVLWAGGLATETLEDSPLALAALVKGLLATALGLRLWVVTQGAWALPDDAVPPRGGQTTAWGFGATLFLEHPDMRGGLLDLDPARPAADQAPDLLAALAAAEGFAALRGGRLLAQRLSPRTIPAVPKPLTLRGDGCHVITGGLGGLGLATARWLVERGARHLALIGRRGLPPRDQWDAPGLDPETRARAAAVRDLEALGATVEIHVLDMADLDGLRARLAVLTAPERLPLRGVVHAAGVNWFSRIAAIDPAHLADSLRLKASAAQVLHEATRSQDLDLFVLYSSVSALWGSVDLAHYSAANLFLDALAMQRRHLGLPATCIDWGPWAEVGMSAKPRELAVLARLGLRPMPPAVALDALEDLITAGIPQAVVADIDWRAFHHFVRYATAPAFFARVMAPEAEVATPQAAPATTGDGGPAALHARLRAAAPTQAMEHLLGLIQQDLAAVMFLPGGTTPDPDQRFNLLGMDSLVAIAFALRLEGIAGRKLPPTLAYNYPTPRAVAEHLFSLIRDDAAPPSPLPSGAVAEPSPPPTWRRWLPEAPTPADGRPLLYTLPYAGAGAAAYGGWAEGLAAHGHLCPLALPGRDQRGDEPMPATMAVLVEPLAAAIAAHRQGLGASPAPYVLFGHSLGGLIAYETALALAGMDLTPPAALVLSCCLPQGAPPDATPLHLMDAEALHAAARDRFALPPDILAHADLWASVLPVLRGDLRLMETWQPDPARRLSLPLVVIGGRSDRVVPVSGLTAWAERTTGPLSLHLLDGGHMLTRDQEPALLALLARVLARVAAGETP